MEVLPEPLFMWGIAAAFDGDFLGNLAGLWSGKLPYASPEQTNNSPVSNFVGGRPNPNKQGQKIQPMGFHQPQGKVKPHKVVSNMFLDEYTNKYKKS